MDLRASVCDNRWFSGHGHRQRKLHHMGNLQQPCSADGNEFIGTCDHISVSTYDDDLLLLENRLRSAKKGRSKSMIYFWRLKS